VLEGMVGGVPARKGCYHEQLQLPNRCCKAAARRGAPEFVQHSGMAALSEGGRWEHGLFPGLGQGPWALRVGTGLHRSTPASLPMLFCCVCTATIS